MDSTPDFGKINNGVRRPRLPDNLIRIQFQKSNGQFKITIPRGLAKSLRLKGGDVLEVFIERGDLVLRVREVGGIS